MTMPFTIDELPVPASLDAPEANEFRAANELHNTVLVEALGPAADPDTPSEMLAFGQDQPAKAMARRMAERNDGRPCQRHLVG